MRKERPQLVRGFKYVDKYAYDDDAFEDREYDAERLVKPSQQGYGYDLLYSCAYEVDYEQYNDEYDGKGYDVHDVSAEGEPFFEVYVQEGGETVCAVCSEKQGEQAGKLSYESMLYACVYCR